MLLIFSGLELSLLDGDPPLKFLLHKQPSEMSDADHEEGGKTVNGEHSASRKKDGGKEARDGLSPAVKPVASTNAQRDSFSEKLTAIPRQTPTRLSIAEAPREGIVGPGADAHFSRELSPSPSASTAHSPVFSIAPLVGIGLTIRAEDFDAVWPTHVDGYTFVSRIFATETTEAHVAAARPRIPNADGEDEKRPMRPCMVRRINFERVDMTMAAFRANCLSMSTAARCHSNVLGIFTSFVHQHFLYLVQPNMSLGSFTDVLRQRQKYVCPPIVLPD